MFKALNTLKNRDLLLVGCSGELLFVKNDMVYFKLTYNNKEFYLVSDKGYFKLNFRGDFDLEDEMKEALKKDDPKFLDYALLKKLA